MRDQVFLLRQLRTVDHLPVLENAHTGMSSASCTWSREGAISAPEAFKRIEGERNVLLDIAGPGCIHRVLTARVGKDVAGTRIQVFLDGSPQAVFDTPVDQFLDDKNGPLPYRLLFHKPYPGVLLHVTWPHEKEWWGEGDNPGTFVPNLFDRSNQWRWPSVDQSSHCSRRTLNP